MPNVKGLITVADDNFLKRKRGRIKNDRNNKQDT